MMLVDSSGNPIQYSKNVFGKELPIGRAGKPSLITIGSSRRQTHIVLLGYKSWDEAPSDS
jgi:hypothetical protein